MRLFLAFIVLSALYGFLGPAESTPNLLPSLDHLLGTDELGRDVTISIIQATGLTIIKAAFLTTLSVGFALLVVFFLHALGERIGSLVFRSAILIIESCPVILWIFIVIVALLEAPRLFAVSLAFLVVIVPILASVLNGEYERLSRVDFVQAARSVGVKEWIVLASYILPNSVAVVVPLIINVFGAAMTIDGAIGLVGMGNRSQLDLGIMIVRAKEQILIFPWLAAGVGLAILVTFWGLYLLRSQAMRSTHQHKP